MVLKAVWYTAAFICQSHRSSNRYANIDTIAASPVIFGASITVRGGDADLSSDRRALGPPGCHVLEHTIPKDQSVHQRRAEMDEKSGEQQERKRRMQRSQQRVERVAMRQDRRQMNFRNGAARRCRQVARNGCYRRASAMLRQKLPFSAPLPDPTSGLGGSNPVIGYSKTQVRCVANATANVPPPGSPGWPCD
jgi:hypothetical protein